MKTDPVRVLAVEELRGVPLDDGQRAQVAALCERLGAGLSLEQHMESGLRDVEAWRVRSPEGEELDVWLCSVPRGVVFAAGSAQVVSDLIDGASDASPDWIERASQQDAATLLGRWGRRIRAVRDAEDARTPEEPPPGPPFTQPVPPGTAVFAKWRKRWWPATVLSEAEGSHRIHYEGWESQWDEYVPLDRLCRPPEPMRVAEGDAVSIEYRGSWYAGRVLAIHPDGRARVTYDGWDASWDEDVVPTRLRPPGESREVPAPTLPGSPLASSPAAGSEVLIEYDGTWYAGRILAVVGDRFRVTYDDWDASWDEDVELARLRGR